MKISAITNYKYNINNNLTNKKISFNANISESGSFFDKVDDNLYRGRMPKNSNELKELKDFGISEIVNLTTGIEYKPEMVEELGMKYNDLSFTLDPSIEIIDSFFNIIKNVKEKDEKVYVHCYFGSDRTELMVNLYKLYNKMPLIRGFAAIRAKLLFDKYMKCRQ